MKRINALSKLLAGVVIAGICFALAIITIWELVWQTAFQADTMPGVALGAVLWLASLLMLIMAVLILKRWTYNAK